jgi:hypothetical protein
MSKKFSIKFNKKTKFLLPLGLIFSFTCLFLIQPKTFISRADADLIAYWNFDKVPGWEVQDESGNDINGYIGSALSGVAGQKGYGLRFDGVGDYVTMGDVDKLDFGSEDSFTLSAWVKLNDSIGDYRAILGKASGSSLDGYVLRHCQNGNLSMLIEASDDAIEVSAVAKQDYRDGQWHHLVGVINRGDNANTIYVDGFQKAQADISLVGDLSNSYYFNIGALSSGNVSFKGFIDEVRIYNQALSATEIQQLYSQESGHSVVISLYPAGSLLQANNSYDVYYINKNGQRKLIVNENVFNLYNNKWEDVIKVTAQELEQYPIVKLIRADKDEKVYTIDGADKQWIKTLAEFESLGYQWNDVDIIKSEELDEYQED